MSPADRFSFRDLHPAVDIGTASDRYAGWIGQIYGSGRYDGRIRKRKKRLGKKTYEERVLPVECVREYFLHFPVLELDFTFYRPLLDADEKPTSSFLALEAYAAHLEEGNRIILKVPQLILARHLYRGGSFAENGDYLNARLFTRRFYEPAVDLLGEALGGFVFEQEYQRAREREPAADLARGLGDLFARIPQDDRYHLELRTEAYLSEPVFQVLRDFGVGQVLSHWTWLPRLREQHRKSGGEILNAGGRCLLRLMTPRGMRYEEAFERAFPFDRIVEGMMSQGMIDDTVSLMKEAASRGSSATVIVNNRAGGNAPLIAEQIAGEFRKS
jgi:uncharacterized protein YecE (DUF72 family)